MGNDLQVVIYITYTETIPFSLTLNMIQDLVLISTGKVLNTKKMNISFSICNKETILNVFSA